MRLNLRERLAVTALALFGVYCCGGDAPADPMLRPRSVIFVETQDGTTEVLGLHGQLDHITSAADGSIHGTFRRTFVRPGVPEPGHDFTGSAPDADGCYALELPFDVVVPKACLAGPDDLRGAATAPGWTVPVTFIATGIDAKVGKILGPP